MHRVVLELVAVASQCNHPLLSNRTLWENLDFVPHFRQTEVCKEFHLKFCCDGRLYDV